jgi:hypothetical protein
MQFYLWQISNAFQQRQYGSAFPHYQHAKRRTVREYRVALIQSALNCRRHSDQF